MSVNIGMSSLAHAGCSGESREQAGDGLPVEGSTPSPVSTVYTADHVLEFLDERASWLDREIRNGGDLNHLTVRYRECKHIAECIRDTKRRLESVSG